MGRVTLSNAMAVEDPAMSWAWSLQLTPPSAQGLYPMPEVYVQDFQSPFSFIDIKPRYRGGGHIYMPGDVNIDQFSVTFYETQQFRIIQYLQTWQNLIVRPHIDFQNGNGNYTTQRNYRLPKDYMGEALATFYSNKGVPSLRLLLDCIWPARITDLTLNYGQSTHIPISCVFACTNCTIDYVANKTTTPSKQITRSEFAAKERELIPEVTLGPLGDPQ